MGEYFHSSLLEGDEAIPEGDYAESNMLSTVVPFRNGIMLSVAVGMAESRGLQHVMFANDAAAPEIYTWIEDRLSGGQFVDAGI